MGSFRLKVLCCVIIYFFNLDPIVLFLFLGHRKLKIPLPHLPDYYFPPPLPELVFHNFSKGSREEKKFFYLASSWALKSQMSRDPRSTSSTGFSNHPSKLGGKPKVVVAFIFLIRSRPFLSSLDNQSA